MATIATSEPAASPPAKGAPWATALKWALIATSLLLAAYVATKLAAAGHALAVVGVAFVAMAVLVVYGTRRNVPAKYLLPGLLLLVGLQVWPIVYTAATSFTNYGQGHLVSKDEATKQNIAYSVQQVPGSPTYGLSVAVKDGQDVDKGDLYFLLADEKGTKLVGDTKGTSPLTSKSEVSLGRIVSAEGYHILNLGEANRRKDLATFAVPTASGGGIKASGATQAFEGKPTLRLDESKGELTDTATGTVYVARHARWEPKNGQGSPLAVGWKESVGFANYTNLFTNPTLRSGFLGIFAWNIAFAILSVLTTFVLGMLLALLLNDPRMKGKAIYRSLLILPYAVPVFVSALVWASMFNQQFGLINSMTGLDIDWMGNPWAARAAILIVNLWLGFPYMFVVCTGALQSLPGDVMEAARIDGAGPLRTLRSITLPLLLVAVGPLLIASFAFNFNNFGLIYLVTKGAPFVSGDAQIGSTDLLITYAFRLAMDGTSPNFGFASAIAVVIFIIVALLSFPGFLRSKALEEVN